MTDQKPCMFTDPLVIFTSDRTSGPVANSLSALTAIKLSCTQAF